MGIKDLWSILTPFCERKPLYELQGKTVAVDLSCWICEAQNITEYVIQPRMYLRNLYFRTSCLLLLDVRPVFVLEGKAPALKYDTIASRNAVQFKGARPKTNKIKTGKDRTRFHHTLRLCQEMLSYLGLSCVQGNGEAEAMCAYLNADGLVDGCISQDSDCFAYGAKIVYRNFSISQQGAHSGTGGAVDVYDINRAVESMDFGRNKIIALALLCGSDYSEGVRGVGKDSAIKLFNRIADEDILNRLRQWRSNGSLFAEFEAKLADKNVCTSCGHFGKLQAHTKAGCISCKTTKGCDFTKFKDERLEIKNEVNVRSKALLDANFPDEELIEEFSKRKDNVDRLDLKWKRPDLINFTKFAAKYLTWEEIYSFEKLLPILTRWQLMNYDKLENTTGCVFPEKIKKKRSPKGVPSYEVIWRDGSGVFEALIPKNQLEKVDLEKLWSTIEPQSLVHTAYPNLLAEYEQSKIKPKKLTVTKRRNNKQMADKKNAVDEIGEMLLNTSISEPKPKQIKRRGRRKEADLPAEIKVKTIDSYFKQALMNNFNASSTPVKKNAKNDTIDWLDLEQSRFHDEDDSLNLSDLIGDIISRPPPDCLRERLKNVGYVCLGKN